VWVPEGCGGYGGRVAITTHRPITLIVRVNEQDVGPFSGNDRTTKGAKGAKGAKPSENVLESFTHLHGFQPI
jgi:hypothetical protein